MASNDRRDRLGVWGDVLAFIAVPLVALICIVVFAIAWHL